MPCHARLTDRQWDRIRPSDPGTDTPQAFLRGRQDDSHDRMPKGRCRVDGPAPCAPGDMFPTSGRNRRRVGSTGSPPLPARRYIDWSDSPTTITSSRVPRPARCGASRRSCNCRGGGPCVPLRYLQVGSGPGPQAIAAATSKLSWEPSSSKPNAAATRREAAGRARHCGSSPAERA